MTRRTLFAAIAAAVCPPRLGLSQQMGGSSPPAELGCLHCYKEPLTLDTLAAELDHHDTLLPLRLHVSPELFFRACELMHPYEDRVLQTNAFEPDEWAIELRIE
jgi:hypothetical protein